MKIKPPGEDGIWDLEIIFPTPKILATKVIQIFSIYEFDSCEYEEKARIYQSKLRYQVRLFKNSKREFFSKTKVLLAPALNYQNYQKKTSKKENILKIQYP